MTQKARMANHFFILGRNYMNFEILSKTKVVGLKEDSLTSFQNFMFENIAWDSQVRADYYQSNKNTVLLELPVRYAVTFKSKTSTAL